MREIRAFWPKILSIFLLAAVLIFPDKILAQEVTIYDKGWRGKERIQDGNIYDQDWKVKGYIEDSRSCDKDLDLKKIIKVGNTF